MRDIGLLFSFPLTSLFGFVTMIMLVSLGKLRKFAPLQFSERVCVELAFFTLKCLIEFTNISIWAWRSLSGKNLTSSSSVIDVGPFKLSICS